MPNSNSNWAHWAPMNNNYGNPYTWQPNTQYPAPSTYLHNQRPENNLIRVTGPESAKAYPVPPGSSVVLFDADNPIFYLLEKDDSGFPSLRTFEFSEKAPVVEVQPVPTPTNELKEEVDGLKNDISEIKKLLEGLVG